MAVFVPTSASEAEALIIELLGDASSYLREIQAATQATATAAQEIARHSRSIEQFAANVGRYASFATRMLHELGISLGVVGLAAKSLSLAAEAESMQVQFGVLLGNVSLGAKMYQDLARFAAETPLEMPGVTQAARTLLQYNIAGSQVIPTLRMLGDVAGGNDERLQRLAMAYGHVSQRGYLLQQDMRQMIANGFNPLNALAQSNAQTMGGTVAANFARLQAQVRTGTITFEQVAEAFKFATSEGGQFHNMMLTMAQTLGGLWSTLRDEVRMALRDIGLDIAGTLDLKNVMRSAIAAMKDITEVWTSLPRGLKEIIIYGTLVIGALSALALVIYVLSSAYGILYTAVRFAIQGIMAMATAAYAASSAMGVLAFATGVAVVAAVYAIGSAMWNSLPAVQALNVELERSIDLGNRLAAVQGRGTNRTETDIRNINDPEERRAALEREIATTTANLRTQEGRASAAQVQVAGLRDSRLSLAFNTAIATASFGMLGMDSANQNIDDLINGPDVRGNAAQRVQQRNATAEHLQRLQEMLHALDPGNAASKLAEDVQKLNRVLEHSVNTFGLTSDQVKIYDMAMKGASVAQLQIARGLSEQHEAQKLTHQFEDPTEKFAREAARLQYFRNRNEIDEGTFTRGMEHAEDALTRVSEKAQHATDHLKNLQGALMGSGEAATRMEQYLLMLSTPVEHHEGRHPQRSQEAMDRIAAGRSRAQTMLAGAINTPWGVNWGDPMGIQNTVAMMGLPNSMTPGPMNPFGPSGTMAPLNGGRPITTAPVMGVMPGASTGEEVVNQLVIMTDILTNMFNIWSSGNVVGVVPANLE